MRRILHVLPHPGGGGETYVDSLAAMPGYRFERCYLAPDPTGRQALFSVVRKAPGVQLRARRHDLLHVHGEVAAAVCLPSLALRPSVVTLHGLHLLRRLHGVGAFAAQLNLRLVLRAASRTICVATDERDDVVAAVGRGCLERLVVIHNGVAPSQPPTPEERAAARESLGISAGTAVGAWVGSLDDRKDPLTAVRAVVEIARNGAQFVLLVAGDGPLRPDVERAAAWSDGDAVRVLGFCTDVRSVLAAADMYVSTSHREGLSYSLLEAMSMMLPGVVSDSAGNPEAVGDAGIVVPRGDVEAVTQAFRKMVGDEATRLDLGRRARTRVEQHFRLDEMVSRTQRVYDEVLATGG